MPTLEERVTRLEEQMDELKGYRARPEHDLSGILENLRTQSRLIQSIADSRMHEKVERTEQSEKLSRLESGVQEIIGMLKTLLDRADSR